MKEILSSIVLLLGGLANTQIRIDRNPITTVGLSFYITLPDPATCKGRLYNFVDLYGYNMEAWNSVTNENVIFGNMFTRPIIYEYNHSTNLPKKASDLMSLGNDAGSPFDSKAPSNKITIQSNGVDWVVIGY